jgi:hypothetical protein
VAQGSIQPVTEMSTRNISWMVKAAGELNWQPYHLHVPIVLKSESLNLLEPPGPVQACNGMAFTFSFFWRNSPQCARAASFTRFLDHTQRRTTISRTPLDEWSARRRDLYLTTHNTFFFLCFIKQSLPYKTGSTTHVVELKILHYLVHVLRSNIPMNILQSYVHILWNDIYENLV